METMLSSIQGFLKDLTFNQHTIKDEIIEGGDDEIFKEADMFAIWRPGPYLCAEFEMVGFPSWLLRDPHMRLRANYGPYLNATEHYFKKLISIGKNHQFKDGGPIIAVQVENEFGGGGNTHMTLESGT